MEQCIAGVMNVIFASDCAQEASSAELVSERYAVQAIPTDETNGCQKVNMEDHRKEWPAYNLELNWNNTEVENLHSRPQHVIGLESRQIHVS